MTETEGKNKNCRGGQQRQATTLGMKISRRRGYLIAFDDVNDFDDAPSILNMMSRNAFQQKEVLHIVASISYRTGEFQCFH